MKEKKKSTFVGDSTYVRARLHIEVPCSPIIVISQMNKINKRNKNKNKNKMG
jgi:hypothetical protein